MSGHPFCFKLTTTAADYNCSSMRVAAMMANMAQNPFAIGLLSAVSIVKLSTLLSGIGLIMNELNKLKYFSIGLCGLAFLALCFDILFHDNRYGLIALVLCLMCGGLEIIRHIFKKIILQIEELKK
jgi:hypothetical protein